MNLEKAYLEPTTISKGVNPDLKKIQFMFNPTAIQFDYKVETNEDTGSHADKGGRNKLSFSYINAPIITIKDIFFDTYEERESVQKYIDPFISAVNFIKPGGGNASEAGQTIPSYRFIWGTQVHPAQYIIDNLSYTFTMFLPDGTPVRAVVESLTLKQHEEKKGPLIEADRQLDSLESRGIDLNRKINNVRSGINAARSGINTARSGINNVRNRLS